MKQKIFVRCFTKLIWGTADIGPWFGVNVVIDQWINHALCVSYFIGYNLGSFGHWPVIKADTMFYLLYWVYLGYSQ